MGDKSDRKYVPEVVLRGQDRPLCAVQIDEELLTLQSKDDDVIARSVNLSSHNLGLNDWEVGDGLGDDHGMGTGGGGPTCQG